MIGLGKEGISLPLPCEQICIKANVLINTEQSKTDAMKQAYDVHTRNVLLLSTHKTFPILGRNTHTGRRKCII